MNKKSKSESRAEPARAAESEGGRRRKELHGGRRERCGVGSCSMGSTMINGESVMTEKVAWYGVRLMERYICRLPIG